MTPETNPTDHTPASGTAAGGRARTVTPHIVVRGAAKAAAWYAFAFGARTGRQIPAPSGKYLEIELLIGDSTVMMCDEFPEHGALSPVSAGGTCGELHITTENVDALWARAVEAGALISRPLRDAPRGDRHGQVIDPFGHRWSLTRHSRDESAAEPAHAAATMPGSAGGIA